MRKHTLRSLLLICNILLFSGAFGFSGSFQVTPKDIHRGYISEKIRLSNYAMPDVTISGITYTANVNLPKDAKTADPRKPIVAIAMERKVPYAIIHIPVYSTGDNNMVNELSSFNLDVKEKPLPSEKHNTSRKTDVTSSLLSTGTWYKIGITKTGFYKIDYNFINSLGINPSSVTPSNIRIAGNGGAMLPEDNSVARPSDLVENAIWVNSAGSTFGSGDYAVFYGVGTVNWTKDSINQRFIHQNNLYTDTAYYFISFDNGPGLRIPSQPSVPNANVVSTGFNYYDSHEADLVSPTGGFGKLWYGEEFNPLASDLTQTFTFAPGNTFIGNAYCTVSMASTCDAAGSSVSFSLNSNIPAASEVYSQPTANDNIMDTAIISASVPVGSPNDQLNVAVTFTNADQSGLGYLYYIEVNARSPLTIVGNQMAFADWQTVGAGNTASYSLQGANSFTQVWDVTNPQLPVLMHGTLSGSNYNFSQDASMLHQFAAMNNASLYTPSYIKQVAPQNLHAMPEATLIIVTYPAFLDAANQLASFHQSHDKMSVVVATTEQVYNEFSSGAQDISAIRDFAKMFYDRGDSATMPKYLLFFGGPSYDYLNRIQGNSNLVPVYETWNSFDDLSSYSTDDFYGYLDNNENINNTSKPNILDIAVGRFPVRDVADADSLVNKIISYTLPQAFGPWRIADMFVACRDDGAGAHMVDADEMATDVETCSGDLYNLTKVYEDNIPIISTPAGDRCPNANAVIDQQIFTGCFMVNYNGHGNTQVWSGERILTNDDYNAWTNRYMLPFMVTATCDFGQFDHPQNQSAAEQILLRNGAGSIAMLTTTQAVFAIYNVEINSQYVTSQYTPIANGVYNTFGSAYLSAKNTTYVESVNPDEIGNFQKFALLGDPALTPAFPQYKVYIDSTIDGITMQPTDTISALGKYIIKGSVKDYSGNVLSDFNGDLWISFYDKPVTDIPLDGGGAPYQVQNNIIYKGLATVNNGYFSVSFVTPKDINYYYGKGKISTYTDNMITDAAGVDTSVVVGGFSKNPVLSTTPPIIDAYINDSFFINGGITGTNTSLFLKLIDSTGINVSGYVIGHDLVAILDGNNEVPYVLNNYYQTAPNSYQVGYVNFPVYGLADGKHNFKVTAWDVNDNFGEGSVDFVVVDGQVVDIQSLMNYPNPFSNQTNFVFEHNHPFEQADIQINICNTQGKNVRNINESITLPDSRTAEISWDGTDNNGAKLPSGVYVYQLVLTTETGIRSIAYQKLLIVR